MYCPFSLSHFSLLFSPCILLRFVLLVGDFVLVEGERGRREMRLIGSRIPKIEVSLNSKWNFMGRRTVLRKARVRY